MQPLLADVVPPNHPWKVIAGMRFGGDAGVCMGRLLPRHDNFGTGWNYSWPEGAGGGGARADYNGTDYLAGGPLPLLRRYLGRRAWPFPTEASHVAGLASSSAASRMERRAVVLICRRSSGRVFVPGVEEQLVAALRASTGREVYVYRGNETVAQTVGVFANARAVVGYHGAGFANTMLSAHGACVLEVSTNTDTAGEKLWRTNAFMCLPWNPSLRWAVYRVPLTQMLDANGIKYNPNRTTTFSDQQVKGFPWVPLRPTQVGAIAAATHACLVPLERGHPWPLLDFVNASQRMQPTAAGGQLVPHAYIDRVDLHALRHASARHGASSQARDGRPPSIDEQLHWGSAER